MAGKKYIKLNTVGNLEQEASVDVSAGAGDATKIVALDANGLISRTMIPTTPARTFTASEAIAAGAFVNIWDSTGTKVRNADASGGVAKGADGVAVSAISNAASGIIDLDDLIIGGLVGLTVGAYYFLDAVTPGAITATPPTTAGHIVQKVGKAISTTELAVEIDDPIILA